MRSMQRLRHVRVPTEPEVRRIHDAERRSVARKERRLWLRRLRAATRFALVAVLLVLVGRWIWGGRFLADGLVEADLVVVQAPARVRVAEVFCEPGQRCVRGMPLVRLESLAPPEERRALELALEQDRVRLRLYEAGGELGDGDVARRGERVVEAQREARLAEAERAVAVAALERLARERAVLELALREEQARQAGLVESLEERVAAARSLIAEAQAAAGLADWDARSRLELSVQGLVSDRDLAAALSTRDAARGDLEGLSATARSLAREVEAARAVAALGAGRAHAALDEMAGRLAEGRAQVDALAQRRDQWSALAERQRELGASGAPGEAARLRDLELELLRAQVAEAEARLAAHDARAGQGVIRAQADGLVERVFVGPGSVLEAGEPLVRTYDPTRMRVVAYLDRDGASRAWPGRPCRILGVREELELDGRVRSVDAVWAPCPPALPARAKGSTDMRLPVHVECVALDEKLQLRPNMRVRVLFKDEEHVAAAGD